MTTEPKIFEYAGCFYDPFKVERVMNSVLEGDVFGAGVKMESDVPEISHRAIEWIKRAVCMAFDIMPWDNATGQGTKEDFILGVPDYACPVCAKKEKGNHPPTCQRPIGIWEAFLDWREKKNVTTATSPTSPPPTELPPELQAILKRSMASG